MPVINEKKLSKKLFFFVKQFEVWYKYLYLQTNVNLNFTKALLILI